MKYDIFISYSSHDRGWARKLDADLKGHGVNCFLDQTRLTKGEKWEPALLGDLLNSRHFLVLWSEKARGSDWVSEELYRFKASIDPKGDGQLPSGRLLYAINLEGQNATLAAYQGYLDSAIQDEYKKFLEDVRQAGGPPQDITLRARAATQSWNSWIAEIAGTARANNPAIQVPVAALALTQAILGAHPPQIPEFSFVTDRDVDAFLQHLGAGPSNQLNGRYGASALEWKPTDSTETVKDLLTDLLSDPQTGINPKLAQLKQPPIQWRYLDVISCPMDKLSETAQPLLSGPSLIIIDPVSLFSFPIWSRYIKLGSCFLNPQAAIIFLTPFGSDPLHLYLRQCLTEQGKPNLEGFHDPIPFNPAYANCGINISDKWDIRRLVLASLGRQPSTQQPTGGEHIVR